MPAAEQLAQGLRRLGPLLAEWPFPAAVIGGIAIIARVSPTLDMGYVRSEAARLSLIAALELYFGPP